jgi:hypothetical protein
VLDRSDRVAVPLVVGQLRPEHRRDPKGVVQVAAVPHPEGVTRRFQRPLLGDPNEPILLRLPVKRVHVHLRLLRRYQRSEGRSFGSFIQNVPLSRLSEVSVSVCLFRLSGVDKMN